MVAIVGSSEYRGEEARVVSLQASRSFRQQQNRVEQVRALARRPRRGEADSVRFAMRAIEYRIVRGLWVLEISLPSDGPLDPRRNGLDYMREREDHFAAGEWQNGPARPPIPSNKEIEAAKEAVRWIDCLEPTQARLLRVAAQTKRGDRERNVNWPRVLERVPELRGLEQRTLQERYDRALRWIVAELTVQRLSA